jgi:hypothetical protein
MGSARTGGRRQRAGRRRLAHQSSSPSGRAGWGRVARSPRPIRLVRMDGKTGELTRQRPTPPHSPLSHSDRFCRQGKARISRVCGLDPGPLGHQRRGMGPADPAAVGQVAALGQLFQRGSRAIAATRPAARRPSPGQPGRRACLSPIIESFFPISHATRNRSSCVRGGRPGGVWLTAVCPRAKIYSGD